MAGLYRRVFLAAASVLAATPAMAEVGYVACVYTKGGLSVNYAWRTCTDFHDGTSTCDAWQNKTTDGNSYTTITSTPNGIADEEFLRMRARVRVEVSFDHLWDDGNQYKTYTLETTKERSYIDSTRCDPGTLTYRSYHFEEVSGGIELYTD